MMAKENLKTEVTSVTVGYRLKGPYYDEHWTYSRREEAQAMALRYGGKPKLVRVVRRIRRAK